MVLAYIDDGGSENVTVLGAYVASHAQWEDFRHEWTRFLNRFGLSTSHGNRLVTQLGKLDAQSQAEFFLAAREIVDCHTAIGLLVWFQDPHFERYYRLCSEDCPAQTKHQSAFGLAFSKMLASIGPMVIHEATLGRLQFPPNERIDLVLDKGNSRAGAASEIFNRRKSAGPNTASEYAHLLGNLSFGDDEDYPGLQAADLLAWCYNRLHVSDLGETPNAFFSSQIRPPNVVTIGHFDMLDHKNEVLYYLRT